MRLRAEASETTSHLAALRAVEPTELEEYVSATAGGGSTQTDGPAQGPAQRLGFKPGMVIQELGWDNDTDDELRVAIENTIDADLVDSDYGNVVDAVLLWWRDEDGDLVDGLVDALTDLVGGGAIWLLTPKVGRSNAVNPAGSYGLFQFVPSTWASTPYANEDIFDAYASANAAGWMWSVGRRNEWVCQ